MSNTATILIKRGSGMTSAALALAVGLEAAGEYVTLIVPTMNDVKNIKKGHFGGRILPANDLRSLTAPVPDVYIIDDALRCAEEFGRFREGDLLVIARERLSIHQDAITRIFLFQHAL